MIEQSQSNMMIDPTQNVTNNYQPKQLMTINQQQPQTMIFENDQNTHEIQTINDMNRLKQPNQSYTNRNLIIASNANNQTNDNNSIPSLLHQPPQQPIQISQNSNIQVLIPQSQKSPQPQQQQQQQPLFQKRYSNIQNQNQNNQNRHLYDRRTNSFPQMNVNIVNKSSDELVINNNGNNNQISPIDNNLNIISPSSNALQAPNTINLSQMSPTSPIQMQFQNNMMQPQHHHHQQQQPIPLLNHSQMYQHQNQNIRFQGNQMRGGQS